MEEEKPAVRVESVYDKRKSPILVTIAPENSEPTDAEFYDIFNKYNKSSWWFVLMFILSCLPTFCIEAGRASLTITKNMEGNCIFPNLMMNNWTFPMITEFTQPENAKYCNYLVFDYNKIQSYGYIEAMELKKKMPQLPPTKVCGIPVKHKFYSWSKVNFLRTCASLLFKEGAATYGVIGEMASVILLGIAGDIWGRKIGLWFAYIGTIAAMVLHLVARHYYSLCIAYFCEGFSYAGWSLLSYILFLEFCNSEIRGILCIYLTSWRIIAKLMAYYVKFHTSSYYVAYLLCSIQSLSLLFYLFYVPESPRWLLSYGKKAEAWQLLYTFNIDVSKYTFLPIITLPKRMILVDNLKVLFLTRRFFRTLLGIGILQCMESIIYMHKATYVHVKELRIPAHKMILVLGDIFSFFNVLSPFIVFGRYISICVMYAFNILFLTLNLILDDMEGWIVINSLIVLSLSSIEFVITLYCCELLPTSARGTGLALAWTIAQSLRAVYSYCIKMIFAEKAEDVNTQNYILFALGVTGILGLVILPNYRVHFLPDFKRYRNVVET